MIRNFQPILLENLDMQVEGFAMKRVALNRHIHQIEQVDSHAHSHHQFLVYLKGGGTQSIDPNQIYPVERGDVVLLRNNQPHSFQKKARLRPLCLVIDFTHPSIKDLRQYSRLPPIELSKLEQGLIRLGQLKDAKANNLTKAIILIELLEILVNNANQKKAQPKPSPLESKVISRLKKLPPSDWTPNTVANTLAYDVQSLSRQLQLEGSQPLGKVISAHRLNIAKKLLCQDLSIGNVAEQVGILDHNYFSRWFKKQTGHSPLQFKSTEHQSKDSCHEWC